MVVLHGFCLIQMNMPWFPLWDFVLVPYYTLLCWKNRLLRYNHWLQGAITRVHSFGANTLPPRFLQMLMQALCWPTEIWKRHKRVWTCWINLCHHPWMFCWQRESYNLVVKCFPTAGLIIALLLGRLGLQIMNWRWCVFSSWGMADTSRL